jgi:large subunit ribosomal protein L10
VSLQREIKRKRAVEQIEAVRKVAKTAHMGAVVEYRGLTASALKDLRIAALQAGVYIKVIRNTLACRALEETEFSCLQSTLTGPNLLAFSLKEPGSVARLLQEFSKNHAQLIVKNLAFEGQLIDAKDLAKMASLPTREEAIAQLLRTLEMPIKHLLRVLVEPQARFIRALIAIQDK